MNANTIFGLCPSNRLLAQSELKIKDSVSSGPYNVFHLAALVLALGKCQVMALAQVWLMLAEHSSQNLAKVRQPVVPDLGHC